MKIKQKLIIMSILLTFFMAVISPITPVYAFSVDKLWGGADTNAISALFTYIFGTLFNDLFHLAPPNDNSADTPGIATGTQKDVAGFYTEWWNDDPNAYKAMEQNASTMNTIIPFWATLQADGSLRNRGGADHAKVIEFAHKHQMKALMMVNNSHHAGASTPIHTVLNNPDLRAQAVTNLEAYIKQYHLDGINVDFESVAPEDKDNLSDFMQELADRLKPQGYIVSIDVFPKTNEENDVSEAYDYAKLAKSADKIMIMAYDQHAEWSGPGPVADIHWVEDNLRYALKFIPKDKLYLCLAGYGYDWSSKGVKSLDYKPTMDIINRSNVAVKWDDKSQSPYFSYTDNDGIDHTVWYENSESLKFKLNLVKQYDIKGVAVWTLDSADPQDWQVLSEKLTSL